MQHKLLPTAPHSNSYPSHSGTPFPGVKRPDREARTSLVSFWPLEFPRCSVGASDFYESYWVEGRNKQMCLCHLPYRRVGPFAGSTSLLTNARHHSPSLQYTPTLKNPNAYGLMLRKPFHLNTQLLFRWSERAMSLRFA